MKGDGYNMEEKDCGELDLEERWAMRGVIGILEHMRKDWGYITMKIRWKFGGWEGYRKAP